MGPCVGKQEDGLAEVMGGRPGGGDVASVQAQLRVALDHAHRDVLAAAVRREQEHSAADGENTDDGDQRNQTAPLDDRGQAAASRHRNQPGGSRGSHQRQPAGQGLVDGRVAEPQPGKSPERDLSGTVFDGTPGQWDQETPAGKPGDEGGNGSEKPDPDGHDHDQHPDHWSRLGAHPPDGGSVQATTRQHTDAEPGPRAKACDQPCQQPCPGDRQGPDPPRGESHGQPRPGE